MGAIKKTAATRKSAAAAPAAKSAGKTSSAVRPTTRSSLRAGTTIQNVVGS